MGTPLGGSPDSREEDAVLCLHTPIDFRAVGRWYAGFRQLTDDDVEQLLHAYRTELGGHRVRR